VPAVRLLSGALAAAVAAACAPASPGDRAGPPARPATLASLLEADARLAAHAARAGLADALLHVAADDAVVLLPGADLAEGADAVRALLARRTRPARTVLHRIAGGASADGERGYTYGWLEAEGGAGGAELGRWLATWRRDGPSWRVDAFVRAPSRPPSPGRIASLVVDRHHGIPSPGDPRRLRAEAFAADEAFAAHALAVHVAQGFGPAFLAFADPAAVVFGAGDSAWAAGSVEETYGATEPGERLAWRPTHGAAAASGDLAWTVGAATYDLAGAHARLKYLTVWVRQPGGTWRWLLDLGNASP
jgi:ketosteroid isomerase-like protein